MRVLIDGKNLSLSEGTGITTYARNVVSAANELGHQSGVLMGATQRQKSDRLKDEIDIFGATPPPNHITKIKHKLFNTVHYFKNPQLYQISISNKLIYNNIIDDIGNPDEIWNG